MRRLVLTASIAVLVAGLVGSALAQPERRGCGMCPMRGGMERMQHGGSGGMGRMTGMHGILNRAEDLEMEKEQVEKIRDLATNWAEQRVDRTAALQKAQLRLAEEIRADEVDMEEVEKRLETALQARKELKLGHIRHRTEVRNVLTEEQREKLGAGRMECPMMGEQHGQEKQAPRGMQRGRGMRGGGCMHR